MVKKILGCIAGFLVLGLTVTIVRPTLFFVFAAIAVQVNAPISDRIFRDVSSMIEIGTLGLAGYLAYITYNSIVKGKKKN